MVERWRALVERVGDKRRGAVWRAIFDDVCARYGAAERRYHTLEHVEACLRLLDGVRGRAGDADAIELAIWFHDAVYDSRRSDNEACSARLAEDALGRLGVARGIRERVGSLILATRHDGRVADADGGLMVDIDLAILGQPAAVFDAYEAGIRFEYEWVAEAAFRAGRAKVLRGFLERPSIYATEYFRGKLEEAARGNIMRSLARLGA